MKTFNTKKNKLKVIFLIIFLYSSVCFSVVVEIDGKLYKVSHGESLYSNKLKNPELYNTNYYKNMDIKKIENLSEKEVKPEDWADIIATGEFKFAYDLIYTLARYLPDEELLPLLKIGLSRHQNRLDRCLADHAYLIMMRIVSISWEELLSIRTHPIYRKNLTKLFYLRGLYSHTPTKNTSLSEAIDKIRKNEVNNRYGKHGLMTVIALSTDYDELIKLIGDGNFDIAVSSWYALSRLAPNKVAYKITSQAVFRTEKKMNRSGQIVLPAQIAYRFFSDYLSEKQLLSIMRTDPSFKSPELIKTYKFKAVETEKMARLLTKMGASARMPHQAENTIKNASLEELEKLLMTDPKYYFNSLNRIEFDNNILEILKKSILVNNQKIKSKAKKLSWYRSIELLVNYVFISKNDVAKEFIDFLLSDEISIPYYNRNLMVIKGLNKNSRQLYKSWPRDWQDLKTKVNKMQIKKEIVTFDMWYLKNIKIILNILGNIFFKFDYFHY